MAIPQTATARRRVLAVLTATATAAAGAVLLGPGASSASSHREAPYILSDPLADNTDVYAFVSPDNPDNVTLISSWVPFQDPAGGPNFYPFDANAAYDINIDNDGDAKPDIVYRWEFADVDKRGTAERGEADGSFLYNQGPVTSLTDEDLLFRQTYDLQVLTEDADGALVQAEVPLVNDAPVPPDNVGIASIPDFVPLREAAVTPVATPQGAGKTYAGQTDDAFFLDLRIFDLLYGGDFSETGFDTLSGYNVKSVVLEVPKTALVANNDAGANPVIGVWSTTSRAKNRTYLDNNATPTASMSDSSDAYTQSGELVQVSRLGNPLVNEVVVPANLKDFYNRSTPDTDAKFLGKVTDPEVPILVELIYGIPNPGEIEGYENRPDLVATFLTGFSKAQADGSAPGTGSLTEGSPNVDLNSLNLNAVKPEGGAAPAEYLRLNTSIPGKEPGDAGYSPLGVIGGDTSGYPNGRRLRDDTVDITLRVAEGLLVPGQDPEVKEAVSGLGDGVSDNDRPHLSSFPFIADPHAGSDPDEGQTPVSFIQNFTSDRGRVTADVTRITPAQPGGFAQLYRINPDGSQTGLGSMPLNEAGTGIRQPKVFPVPSGSTITLNWRVFTDRTSAFQSNRGIPTQIRVR
jgi:hypothetical protein